jgi:hypothetical protein
VSSPSVSSEREKHRFPTEKPCFHREVLLMLLDYLEQKQSLLKRDGKMRVEK